MNTTITILAAQINPIVGAIEYNAEKIIEVIEKYQENNDLIVFPELVLSGYPPEDLLLRPAFHQRINQALAKIVQKIGDCHVVLGHSSLEDEKSYNAASVFYQGRQIVRYHKQKLPNYGVFDEMRYFTPGKAEPSVFYVKEQAIGLCICEDLWQPGPIQAVIEAKAALLLCLNASPYDETKLAKRIQLLQHYAQQGLAIIYVNLIGGQDELVFDGQSLAIDTEGAIRAHLPAFQEACATITWRSNTLSGLIAPALSTIASIYQALVLAVQDYVQKHGFPGVLLGLSGGIDSALTLVIAVDALGADRVETVMMPSRFSAAMSLEDAQTLANNMGVSYTILPIEPIFTQTLQTLAPRFDGLPYNVTEENIQARIRGLLLMAISNKTGKMVLTTSNKSESAVGYTTLYGDMAGGFAVLKDVLKTQVYELAAYRNQIKAVIPERIMTRAPSAELAENQTDQDSLPPYAVLDKIITAYIENNLDEASILQEGLDANMVKRVIHLIQRNEYKRRQAPPGPKISPRAFGKEWRFPITAKY